MPCTVLILSLTTYNTTMFGLMGDGWSGLGWGSESFSWKDLFFVH